MNTSAPIRVGSEITRFERLDAALLDWARAWRAEEAQFPSLIAAPVLTQAEYPSAFPHLLLGACACADPARPLGSLLAADNLSPTDWLLSPAVCYHAYARWRDVTVRGDSPLILTARGRCFRREAEFVPGRRQLEFEMREIILCGAPESLVPLLAESRARIESLGSDAGLSGRWDAAEDPFFLPAAQGKALLQRIQETKTEYLVEQAGNVAPLALASINRHGSFFGERFGIRLPDGSPAHTACVAFGLDRWAAASRTNF
jgi:hypothetical protein